MARAIYQDNNHGMSLVEVLAVSLIVALVGGVTLVLIQTGRRVWGSTEMKVTSLTQAQIALNRLTEDLRQACRATLSCAAGQVVFKRAPTCDAADPQITYAYNQAERTLTRQIDANPAATVASAVETFAPVCLPDGTVRVTLTAQTTMMDIPTVPQWLESKVLVRNP